MLRRLFILLILISPQIYSQTDGLSVFPNLGMDIGGAIPFPFSDIPDGAGGTPKIYPTMGLGFEYTVHENWRLGVEVNYHLISFTAKADVISQPFYYNNHEDILYFSGKTKTESELRFVEFPLLANYKIGKNWSLIMGGYYSVILEGTFVTEGKDGVLSDDKTITDNAVLPGIADTSYDFNDEIDSWDSGIIVGYRYNISPKLFFWGKFHIGFKSIFKKDFDNIEYELYQMRLGAGISYKLFNSGLNSDRI